MKKTLAKTLLTSFATVSIMASAMAGSYPNRPVSFVIGFPPGGDDDLLTRAIADEFQKEYKVPTAVVNKVGGAASVAALYVKSKPADGYTVGSFIAAVPVVHPLVGTPGLKRDTFEPVGVFMNFSFVIVARANAPYNNLKELAAYAKNNDVRLGHYGIKLPPTKMALVAAKKLGFKYASESAFDSPDCSVLAAKDADVLMTSITKVISCLKSGEVKALASQTTGRNAITPDIPTIGEQIKGLDMTLWNGLFVKKGTPQDIKDKLAKVAKRMVNSPMAAKLAQTQGTEIFWIDAKGAEKRIAEFANGLKMLNQELKK